MNKLEDKQYSFLELLEKVGIKIPIIQRDYAQGRDKAKDIREKFITILFDILTNEKEINLDFVYGTIKDDYLIPLDGQQRLTTLFLLHYYLLDDKELLKKFTYETRVSSREFCSLLIEKDIDKYTKSISRTIKNQTWFFSTWENDPTINAMLNTLDTIQDIFGDIKISNKNLKNITFSFLNLDDFKLTDELYIKMNARGKPLSQFENFKSHFIECIDNTNLENKEYIKAKLDNEWMDIFWNLEKDNLKNTQNEDERKKILKSIDDKYLNFFQNITLFFDTDKKSNEIDIFKFDYSENNIETIKKTLDMISHSKQTAEQITEKLRSKEDYNINIFEDFIKEKLGFSDRLRFYALMQFYITKGNPSDNKALFISYMRVNLNIIHNVADGYDTFRNLIKVIDVIASCLDKSSSKFYENITIQKVTNFGKEFKEEKEKAHLICQDFKWEEEFIKVEKHWYLDGQIRFLIDYATDENNRTIIGNFIKYCDKFNKIFKHKLLFIENKDNAKYQTLIHRALFTFGNYLPQHNETSNKYTFCTFGNYLQEKNENWRNLFSSEKAIYFQYLLDNIKMVDNIEIKLKQIIDNYKFYYEDFKSYFINPKSDWEIISNIRNYQIYFKDSSNIYLNMGTTGVISWDWSKTAEMYSYYLYQKYKKKLNLYYHTSSTEKPCIYLDIGDNFRIDIFYYHKKFLIRLFDRKKNELPSNLLDYLKDKNFEDNKYKNIREYGYWHYGFDLCQQDDLVEFLEELVNNIKELQNDPI